MILHSHGGIQTEHFENNMSGRIVGPEKQYLKGWRKLHNEELHELHCSPTIIGF
jgi:hypothetical protein